MKRFAKLICMILAVLLLLAGCGGEKDAALSADGELGFPGLRWGMTVAEAEEALEPGEYTVLKDEDNSENGAYAFIYKYYEIAIPGMELFVPAEEVRLSFRSYTREDEPLLDSVKVVYAKDADLSAVQAAVEAELGPGTPDEYTQELLWYGENRKDQYMSEEYYLQTAIDYVNYGHLGNLQTPATRLGLLSDVQGHDLEFYDLEEGQFALYFTSALTEVLQKDPEFSRTPVEGRIAFESDGLLVFPGTMWSMTAEQVQTVLGLEDAELTDNELVANCDFAGFAAEVTFGFETWFDGFEPGLTEVEIIFTGETGGLEELLTETLGQSERGVWTGGKTVADFLAPGKLDWYQELSGADPTVNRASILSWTGQSLHLQSPLTLAAQVNQNEQPDPYAEVKALFDQEWYQCALSSLYDSPEKIDLGELFRGCVGDRVSGAELETMLERYDMDTIRAVGNVRITPEEMQPSRFVTEHMESYGRYGFDRDFWTPRQLSAVLFRIGELEYEVCADAIHLHIPSDARLESPLLRASWERARELLGAGEMVCHSWLLSPELPGLLDADSRILAFQRNFTIHSPSEDASFRQWVFRDPNLPDEALPEDTTLQRRLKAFLLLGNTFHDARGRLHEEPFAG